MTKKGYKYRLYPTPDQVVHLEKTFGCCRFVWNHFLAQSIQAYKDRESNGERYGVSAYDFTMRLPPLKTQPEFIWLKEICAIALQQKVRDLATSYQSFFGKGRKKANGYPKFKKKHEPQSFREPVGYFKFKEGKLRLSKCKDPIKIILHRELPSEPSSVTISRNSAGQYFASFICDYQPVPSTGKGYIGIDLGLTNLAAMSNGEIIDNPRHYVKQQKKLALLQRRLSKKQKGSQNRNKARLKVARQHLRCANQRNDFTNQLTTRLVRENQAIAIEDLKVKQLSKNGKLAKHILDANWATFRRQLEYKAVDSQNCKIFIADAHYPSTQICSCCGKRPEFKIKLDVKSWTCIHCGAVHGRDYNASKNLENLIYRTLAHARDNEEFANTLSKASAVLVPSYH